MLTNAEFQFSRLADGEMPRKVFDRDDGPATGMAGDRGEYDTGGSDERNEAWQHMSSLPSFDDSTVGRDKSGIG